MQCRGASGDTVETVVRAQHCTPTGRGITACLTALVRHSGRRANTTHATTERRWPAWWATHASDTQRFLLADCGSRPRSKRTATCTPSWELRYVTLYGSGCTFALWLGLSPASLLASDERRDEPDTTRSALRLLRRLMALTLLSALLSLPTRSPFSAPRGILPRRPATVAMITPGKAAQRPRG